MYIVSVSLGLIHFVNFFFSNQPKYIFSFLFIFIGFKMSTNVSVEVNSMKSPTVDLHDSCVRIRYQLFSPVTTLIVYENLQVKFRLPFSNRDLATVQFYVNNSRMYLKFETSKKNSNASIDSVSVIKGSCPVLGTVILLICDYITPYEFFTLVSFHKSLTYNKSPQISRTLLSILADRNNASISIPPAISNYSNTRWASFQAHHLQLISLSHVP